MLCEKLRRCEMAADVMAPGFWEIGAYKHNVRRIKDGVRQLDEFAKMTKERAEIEAEYAKALQQFGDKWKSHVERSVPAGSVKTAWTDVLAEAQALSEQHNRVRERLMSEIFNELATYKKENHHSSAFRGLKETREIEEAFEKAQRQWKKLHDKMESSKRSYYSACRQEKSALVNLSNCQADSSVSADGAQKFRDRLEKSKEEVHKTRQNYEKYLNEMNDYRTPYMELMSFVFEKCQNTEKKRCKFFLEVATGTQGVLVELIKNPRFSGLHSQLENSLKSLGDSSIQNDLRQWAGTNGTEAPTIWPTFEDYTPEMRTISSVKNNGSKGAEAGGVVLTRQIVKSEDVGLPPGPTSSANSDHGKGSSDSDTSTFDSRRTDSKYNNNNATKPWNDRNSADSPPLSNATPDSAKYGEFDDFHGTHVVKSNATVLYDYNPVEGDEIMLKKGEVIEVLSEPDSLGWCTGRRNGEVGLFPASYVQVM